MMQGTIAELERSGYPIRKIDVEREPQLARRYGVTSVPCFVLVVDGREAGRLTGAARRDELEGLLARAGVRPGAARRETARGQSPDPPPSPTAGGSRGGRASIPPRGPLAAASPVGAVEASGRGSAAGEDLIRASVRLTVADPQGFSHGSGTIIDARQGEALVLTCGHIFRDSQGKGQITVDLCAPGAPQKLSGRLVSYDLESDVALLSIRPGVPVEAARLAPKGYAMSKGDRVITVGCNNGGPATALVSSITAVNKFRAPPNLSVAGLPVQGRSGGGLFAADGRVIGVCNAADPTDNEGLYAALAAIQQELDEAGLNDIYDSAPAAAQGALAAAEAGRPMPVSATEPRFAVGGAAQIVPASANQPAGGPGARDTGDGGEDAEVICIVRSLASPDAKSKVIVLDRASRAFLEQLAADRQAQEARHLTSLKVRAQARPAQPSRR
jgi:hypothetical protein